MNNKYKEVNDITPWKGTNAREKKEKKSRAEEVHQWTGRGRVCIFKYSGVAGVGLAEKIVGTQIVGQRETVGREVGNASERQRSTGRVLWVSVRRLLLSALGVSESFDHRESEEGRAGKEGKPSRPSRCHVDGNFSLIPRWGGGAVECKLFLGVTHPYPHDHPR